MELPMLIEDDDLVFVMTEACNSNCIMCPMSEDSRKEGLRFSEDAWSLALEQAPENPNHITITGGEPFLELEQLLHLLDHINDRWPTTPVLILTNGRALCLPQVMQSLLPRLTSNIRFAIPIHGCNAAQHDAVTQSMGSYAQSMAGLLALSDCPAEIEIRVVCHRLNEDYLHQIGASLLQRGVRITRVNFVAMEMNGCAARHRELLWSPYDHLYLAAEPSIFRLITKGIDTGLYDFPLCALPPRAWPLAQKSITGWKVCFDVDCEQCSVRNACGGLFRSTFLLGLWKAHPIAKEVRK